MCKRCFDLSTLPRLAAHKYVYIYIYKWRPLIKLFPLLFAISFPFNRSSPHLPNTEKAIFEVAWKDYLDIISRRMKDFSIFRFGI